MNKSKSEAEIISEFKSTHRLGVRVDSIIAMLSSIVVRGSVSQDSLEVVDLSALNTKISELINFFLIYEKFLYLCQLSGETLGCQGDKFILDGHEFDTLDKVERAWNNKALL